VTQAADSDASADDRPGDGRPAAGSSRRGRRRRSQDTRKPLPIWQETLLLVGTAVVLALIIKTFFLQAFYIPSGSMRDTLQVDDRILVQKVSYWFGDVHRGDVVVFDDPGGWLGPDEDAGPSNPVTETMSALGLYPTGGHLVKRVIGIGGDNVRCDRGELLVNDVPLDEDGYVTVPAQSCSDDFEVDVPAGHLWVMGDNRQHSADSRVHLGDPGGGFIPEKDVVGKVFVVVWPIDRWQFIHRPGTFDDPALDQAAGLILDSTPVGLALLGVPPLYRRLRSRGRTDDGRRAEETGAR